MTWTKLRGNDNLDHTKTAGAMKSRVVIGSQKIFLFSGGNACRVITATRFFLGEAILPRPRSNGKVAASGGLLMSHRECVGYSADGASAMNDPALTCRHQTAMRSRFRQRDWGELRFRTPPATKILQSWRRHRLEGNHGHGWAGSL